MTTPRANLNDLIEAAVTPYVTDFSGDMRESIDVVLDEWFANLDDRILAMVKDWEGRMGDDDKTLYTLGLRRVRDLLAGEHTVTEAP